MRVCPLCFDRAGLRRRIEDVRRTVNWKPCDFHPRRKGVPIEAVAQIVDGVFRERFLGGPGDDRFGLWNGLDLADTLSELTHADDDQVVEGLIGALEDLDDYWPGDGGEAFYSADYRYTRNDDSFETHSRLWRSFRSSLLYDQRFFNGAAREQISTLFKDIHRQRGADGRPAVYLIRPGEEGAKFFRARTANTEAARSQIEAAPARELGPPSRTGRRPGRLNPSGIAAFYGATSVETCVAELRPPVGGVVYTAEFELLGAICVLDTTRFASPSKDHDPFTRDAVVRAAQWRFMSSFMEEIAKPVLPDDEHREYVATQAVADFLSNELIVRVGGVARGIDAIIYRSAQAGGGGKNIALLGPAALVEGGHGTDDDAFDRTLFDLDDAVWHLPDELPKPRLRLVPGSVTAHQVGAARFTVEPYRSHPSDIAFDGLDPDDFPRDGL